jgi:hypothetical protein
MVMTYRVPIVEITEQFHRAHEALIESLGGSQHIARTTLLGRGEINHWDLMEHNWKLKYGITPRNGSESTAWKYLDFPDERSYTLFLLRWS